MVFFRGSDMASPSSFRGDEAMMRQIQDRIQATVNSTVQEALRSNTHASGSQRRPDRLRHDRDASPRGRYSRERGISLRHQEDLVMMIIILSILALTMMKMMNIMTLIRITLMKIHVTQQI